MKAHASYTMGRLIELRSVLNFCQDILIPPKKKIWMFLHSEVCSILEIKAYNKLNWSFFDY